MSEERRGPKIVAILGTVRPASYTSKALALAIDEVEKSEHATIQVLDPREMDLPFPGDERSSPAVAEIQDLVAEATGLIIATPEYHGSFASALKLVIENLGFPSRLSGKPVALLGVAGGAIGAVKSLEQLRGVCSHVGAIVLPGSVSVAKVRSVFDAEGDCLDERVERQVRSVATGLLEYISLNICPRRSLEALVREDAA